jgi:DNA-binding transcriptional LysR family regulator
MLNQTWLKTFCTLVEVGHFTHTAEKLYMTQSGVSQHIKKLEKHFDMPLLVREGKSFSLTNSGRQLYQHGQQLLRTADNLDALIKQDDVYVGQVNIASPGSVGLKLYPHLLGLQRAHPGLSIDYVFAPNKSIEKSLVEQHLDLALVTQVTDNHQLLSEKVAEEPLVLVTSNKVQALNWSTLLQLGFISHPDAAHHGKQLLSKNFKQFEHIEQFQHRGFSNQISLILEPVSLGLGFTVLPLHAAQAYHSPDLISIQPLSNPVSESLYLCTNKQSVMHNRMKWLKSEIKAYLQ